MAEELATLGQELQFIDDADQRLHLAVLAQIHVELDRAGQVTLQLGAQASEPIRATRAEVGPLAGREPELARVTQPGREARRALGTGQARQLARGRGRPQEAARRELGGARVLLTLARLRSPALAAGLERGGGLAGLLLVLVVGVGWLV